MDGLNRRREKVILRLGCGCWFSSQLLSKSVARRRYNQWLKKEQDGGSFWAGILKPLKDDNNNYLLESITHGGTWSTSEQECRMLIRERAKSALTER